MATGQQVGYRRVSAIDQNTARQLDGVHVDQTFEDKASGKDTKRPELKACLKHVRNGDTLHVHSMDRLARNLADLLALVKDLTMRGVEVRFHKEDLTFSSEPNPMQDLQLAVMGAVAQFERAMIRERQREGIALAKAQGRYKGRPSKLSSSEVKELLARRAQGDNIPDLVRSFGISRATAYKIIAMNTDHCPVDPAGDVLSPVG